MLLGIESCVLLSSERLPILLPTLLAPVTTIVPAGVLVLFIETVLNTELFSVAARPLAFSGRTQTENC